MRVRRVLIVACLAGLGLNLAGCPAVGWFAAQFAPPPKVDPLYTFPKGEAVLVFVDDPTATVQYAPIKAELTERLIEELRANNACDEIVPQIRLLDVGARSGFDQLAISEVGRQCGADVVLYVQIEEFQLKDEPDHPLWHGRIRTSIRVVDVKEGRLWPKGRPDGHPMDLIETPMTPEAASGYRTQLAGELADRMADRIAKCFYKHREAPAAKATWEE